MNRYLRTALGSIATLGIALAAFAANAHPDATAGTGRMDGMNMHGAMHGSTQGPAHGGHAGMAAAAPGATEKQAQEKGAASPEHCGHGAAGTGRGPGTGGHRH